jgi:hypothetical protein
LALKRQFRKLSREEPDGQAATSLYKGKNAALPPTLAIIDIGAGDLPSGSVSRQSIFI